MIHKLTRHHFLGLALCITIILALGSLALAVSTFFDKISFAVMFLILIYCIVLDSKENKQEMVERFHKMFSITKWLSIALVLYFAWDIFTMFYAKNTFLAIKKLPFMLEYVGIFLAGAYYCSTKKRLVTIMTAIGITGTIVSICSYLYYIISRKPTYFQRLSTARDYNVYACLILFSFVFISILLMSYSKWSFTKRILLYIAFCLINMPTFYFAGSRRMIIMIPYFFTLALLFESIRLIISHKAKAKILTDHLAFFVTMVVLFFITTALLPTFAKIGEFKEKQYKEWLTSGQVDNNDNEIDDKPVIEPEKTIGSVLETIDDKSMFDKRSLIYSVAFNDLKTYSIPEFIFGKGAAYDIYLYDTTSDKALLSAYDISEKNQRPVGWLSVHNFTLADLLNGGIIKLFLGLNLVITIICYIMKAISRKKRSGIILMIPFALIFVNNFISGAYGMLNDIFFHLMMIILFGLLCVNQEEPSDETK